MNIDIINEGEYRLTSHGGRRFDLFNRKTNEVHTITKGDYDYIRYGLNADNRDMWARMCSIDLFYTESLPPIDWGKLK